MKQGGVFLTDAQLASEMERCEYCEEKPCRTACPANCSPADFIMAARVGGLFDLKRSAAEIMTNNPFGGTCGLVCPERHCKSGCARMGFDVPVEIPAVQAIIIEKARRSGVAPELIEAPANGRKVAIIGAGPSGIAAAVALAQKGYTVRIFEAENVAGGACNLIPDYRLPREVLKGDLEFALSLKKISLKLNTRIEDPATLLKEGYDAVLIATGLPLPIRLGIPGEGLAVAGTEYLKSPSSFQMKGRVAVIGGGATACDCAVTAKRLDAQLVEMFALERLSEMPLTSTERKDLLNTGIHVSGRVRVTSIITKNGTITGLNTVKIHLPDTVSFNLQDLKDIPGSEQKIEGISHVIVAIGNRSGIKEQLAPPVFYSGDCVHGPSSVVEAVASGKNAASEIDAYLSGLEIPTFEKKMKSIFLIPGYKKLPVPLETDFFGRSVHSPFLLSAAPPTDGYLQMKKAYETGWAGGIIKTSFDNVPIHIPGEYMHVFDRMTWGNCDNVSGHPLDRVCQEVAQLVKEFPDRLTMASTGGPVTGNDEEDKAGWQNNTRKLESSGAMGIEFSLSCPQGGDGTQGDIVSQNPSLTAKIVDWIMEVSDPDVPKLFKLTAAVTSIAVIINAIKEVLKKYPGKKAGLTLANTFPTLFFRRGSKKEWEEGILVGMSGAGVTPISYLTLAKVSNLGVYVSGNAGPMNYKAAADFLALGCRTVQFCTIVMKYGYGIIDELDSGLSHLMAERGIKSVGELIGIALPEPITDFLALSPLKKISSCNEDLCMSCGNCTRCAYLAVTLNEDRHPAVDPARCIGCSICVQKCFSGALYMRDRTPEETAALKEA